jgi:chromosome segregation protein
VLNIDKLRLIGFKSFVEPAELAVHPGLTGIVGPNGCGKSNLVEALRWVMGESSARQLRGDEMDDVVFGGSAGRPMRVFAEVVVELDNRDRSAPAPFRDTPRLEVSRRIDRGRGSLYRVDGREVRARDVQLLFADQASGARSAALVTQGQVAALIAARPAERRTLLEEAAGVGSLGPRRQEAEQRLRAAEANLERINDILATLAGQRRSLEQQVRQAVRYRTLSEKIRALETAAFRLRWQAVCTTAAAAAAEAARALSEVDERTARATALTAERTGRAAALPALRGEDAGAAAALQRLAHERDRLDHEVERLTADRRTCRERLSQVEADLERAQGLTADGERSLAALAAERDRLTARQEGERQRIDDAAAELAALDADLAARETEFLKLSESAAAAEAHRADLSRAAEDLIDRRRRVVAKAEDIAERRRQAIAEQQSAGDRGMAARALAEIAARLDRARREVDAAAADRPAHAEAAAEAAAAWYEADSVLGRLEAERQTLAALVAPGDSEGAVIDALTVEPGLETALAVALGEDLLAPVDRSGPAHWRRLPPLEAPPPLPEGVVPLADFCRGAPALDRRLTQIGVVDDADAAERLHGVLRPGQRLVGRDGTLWRWDGFVAAADGPPVTIRRIEQRRRLATLEGLIAEAAAGRDAAAERRERLAVEGSAAEVRERQARADLRAAETAHDRARAAEADERARIARLDTLLDHLEDAARSVAAESEDLDRRLAAVTAELAALPDPAAARDRVETLRDDLLRRRARQGAVRSVVDASRREATGRRRRLDAVAQEIAGWRQRLDAAREQGATLDERRKTLRSELAALDAAPAGLEARRDRLLEQIGEAETRRRRTGDRLAEAEAQLAELDREQRAVETDLAGARERRARLETAAAQAEENRRSLASQIEERLGTAPERLSPADIGSDEAGGIDACERRLDRLRRERDLMGPVNLRAEEETGALEREIAALEAQKEDLLGAVAKLRRGLGELDREARGRLTAAFEDIDRHFRAVFARLFGGGRAQLVLTDGDDPLVAGLEIMASPPGKRLQSLTLLSGGEQALTALALRFAMLSTRPAPICVLDEVDAPLDDANVDRLCTQLEEMAGSGTRFLVITHHPLTMARMHRLYGVTMIERGVSRLVSVDLERAEMLRTRPATAPDHEFLAVGSID